MANQRGKNVTMISVEMSEEFKSALDERYKSLGYSDRTAFIREAIVEKLAAVGVPLPSSALISLGRAGVGGKPTHKNYILNEKSARALRIVEATAKKRKTPTS